MQKCDWCINEPDCRGVQRSECIVRDYRNFVRESNVNSKEHLMNLLRGHSIDTEEDVEYVAEMLLSNGVLING